MEERTGREAYHFSSSPLVLSLVLCAPVVHRPDNAGGASAFVVAEEA